VIFTTTRPQSNPERIAHYAYRAALAGTYTRSATPYPTSGRLAGNTPTPDDGSAAFLSDDYQPEMADCRGW
jgi:hypothetical protein